MPEVTVQDVSEAVGVLRKSIENYGQESVEYKSAVERTEKALEQQEQKNQAIIAKQAEAEKKALDIEDRIKEFELELTKNSNLVIDHKQLPEYQAIEKMVKFGHSGVSAEEAKTLRMDNGVTGGYLTTTEMDNVLIKSITEMSPVRQVSRVKSTSSKTLEVPKRTSIPVATYEGEAAAGSDSESAYANEQLTAYRQTVTIPYTMDLLNDSQFDLLSEIDSDVAEAFAFGEGNKFVLGTGVKQPEGFLINSTVAANVRTSATSGVVTFDDLLLLTGDLKVGYNPLFGFNRSTLAYLRTLKDGAGNYIWQPGNGGLPNSIAGERYVLFQDMADIASNSLSIVYADFLRGYLITDRTGMVVVRDEFAKKRQAIVEITFHRWNTGQVVLDEAFKVLKTKA